MTENERIESDKAMLQPLIDGGILNEKMEIISPEKFNDLIQTICQQASGRVKTQVSNLLNEGAEEGNPTIINAEGTFLENERNKGQITTENFSEVMRIILGELDIYNKVQAILRK